MASAERISERFVKSRPCGPAALPFASNGMNVGDNKSKNMGLGKVRLEFSAKYDEAWYSADC